MRNFLVLVICSMTFFKFVHPIHAADSYIDISLQNHPDQKFLFAINHFNADGWHTYWKNPGDSGQEIRIAFFKNEQEISFDAKEWPAPKRYQEEGDIWIFGYSNQYSIFYEIPKEFRTGTHDLKYQGTFLICKDICIPERKEINFQIQDGLITTKFAKHLTLENQEIVKRFDTLPTQSQKPKNLEIYLARDGEKNSFVLTYTYQNIKREEINTDQNFLTPFKTNILGWGHETLFYDTAEQTLYGKILVDWDGDLLEPPVLFPQTGKFEKKILVRFLYKNQHSNNYQYFDEQFEHFSLNENISQTLAAIIPLAKQSQTNVVPKQDSQSLLYYLLFAFLGGLILNLMPCVLPVISLKLFSLIVHSEEPARKILKHNLFYTLGVISCFWVLGIAVVALKSIGQQVGWGFQLQSPLFVWSMIILLLILAINLFGVFEFRTPGGNKLGATKLRQGFIGDFSSGVIATILSTPCSAPFLGTALTFAFTTSSINIFMIFTFVGLGLAFPFILTGFFPKLIAFLPKPGLWMETLKRFLGLTLILTAIWLYDVLFGLVDFNFLNLHINTFLLTLFFVFYFFNKIKSQVFWRYLAVLFTFIYGAYTYQIIPKHTITQDSQMQSSVWENFDESLLPNYIGQWVFIDFTAKWCLTCKVNKKLVLDTTAFYQLTKDHNIKLIRADWTQQDPQIGSFLRKFNLVGVPAYFLQNPKGELISLGETITINKIKKNME